MASSRLIFVASALLADVFIIWVIVSIDFACPHVDQSFAHALGFLCARDKTGVGLFGTAGIIVLIGAVLTIIAIGLLLLLIVLIIFTVAFSQSE